MATKPTDAFTTQVSPALDIARAALQDVGLRPHRVFHILETWSLKTARRRGTILATVITEILPSPKVNFVSVGLVALSAGTLRAGSLTLSKISRVYIEHFLEGKAITDGADVSPELNFYYAVKPLGQDQAEFYIPSGDPVLMSTQFAIQLRPLNQRGVLAGIAADQ